MTIKQQVSHNRYDHHTTGMTIKQQVSHNRYDHDIQQV